MEKEVRVEDKYVKWFSELSIKDVGLVGGKAANLGEMTNAGFPVPPGFVITAEAYSYFLEKTGLKEEIYNILKNLDVENTQELQEASNKIREMIEKENLPEDLAEEIVESYDILSLDKNNLKNVSDGALSILKMTEPAFVAVRSSATAEDSSEASFAGQQDTFLNVKGNDELINAVKKCFSSLFTARSIYYRVKKKFEHENVLIAVVVQKMINSDKSGVIFSRNPVGNPENVVVEAVFGLGEGIVSGRIKPDHYVVSRDLEILGEKIAEKKVAIVRDSSGKNQIVKLTEERSKQKVLTNYEIKRLADLALKLEEHYKKPQDIEFAIDSGEIYIVQTRPITTLGEEKKVEKKVEGKVLVKGTPASPGIGSGIVKIIKEKNDLNKIQEGDILVTEMTNPDMVVAMQKSSAIVTDEGGMTSHAAIVSREMGIPCVVGTKNATEILKEGMKVIVNGYNGEIYEGELKEDIKAEILPIVDTETEIKVMVDLPTFAERAAKTNCRKVGLIRLEGLIAESGKHPFGFYKNNELDKYEELLFSGLSKIAEYFDELWIRTSDIRTDEYRNLEGSPQEIEGNPMLGMHGIRYSLKYKEILKAELRAISRVKKRTGILLPQVISVEEVREVKRIIEELNLDVIPGVMVETPAAVQIIENLCKEGINFISFGTNDLTQYTLAVDRNNEEVQYLYDETHPAVLSQIKKVIEVCKKHGVETSICGQAGSKKEMVEYLVKLGIDSISVNADKAHEISKFVKELEEKNLRGAGLDEKYAIEVEEEPEEEKSLENYEESVKENMEEVKRDKKGRILYKVRCSRCNKETEVPFKPEEGRDVYCKECLKIVREEKRKERKENEENKEKTKEKEAIIEEKEEQNNEMAEENKNIEEIENSEDDNKESEKDIEEKNKREDNMYKNYGELDIF